MYEHLRHMMYSQECPFRGLYSGHHTLKDCIRALCKISWHVCYLLVCFSDWVQRGENSCFIVFGCVCLRQGFSVCGCGCPGTPSRDQAGLDLTETRFPLLGVLVLKAYATSTRWFFHLNCILFSHFSNLVFYYL